MANDEKDLDQEFIDEVNAGYILGKYAPEFWDLIVQSTGNSKVLLAMKQGKSIAEKELAEPRLPGWLQNDRLESKKVKSDRSHEKDSRDDLEK